MACQLFLSTYAHIMIKSDMSEKAGQWMGVSKHHIKNHVYYSFGSFVKNDKQKYKGISLQVKQVFTLFKLL